MIPVPQWTNQKELTSKSKHSEAMDACTALSTLVQDAKEGNTNAVLRTLDVTWKHGMRP